MVGNIKIMKIKKLNEFKFYTEIDDDELSEMSNISYNTTGIKDVVIWIGPKDKKGDIHNKLMMSSELFKKE